MTRKTKGLIAAGVTHVFIILLGMIMLYPVIWLVLNSFKPNNMIFSDPSLIPKVWTVENYVAGWKGYAGVSFGVFFRNSLIICLVCVVANLFSCTMAAYAFGRLSFKLRAFWFAMMMMTLMLPGHVVTIPRYMMFNAFHWIDSALYLPIIAPKFLATDAFFVFLLVQFIRGLPKDLDEAATIDGCGKIGIFFRIIIPLATPAMITTALFTFLWTWDDFFNQLLYLSSPAKFTVSRALRTFVGDSGAVSQWGNVLAMSSLAMIPCFVLFFSLQKYFVQGIATSGIKG